ncbi:dimethylsulfonioproprionate lyase family protein [Mesorhizobium sp. 1M-11]|uniref:dimethylsulfonioproprionate lyase family protein n=1 Tax=Mesorhizobium sp. 1M-11 TaxID=1529006 RepID=UPI0006C76CD5|nr:dimethylsulfonioproprionate lyase family protein [Mesorhizobium sp. 1M-11]
MTTNFDELLEAFHAFLRFEEASLAHDAAADIDWGMPARRLEPKAISCMRHLDRIREIAPAAAQPLVRLLAGNREVLRWGQTYTEKDFGHDFLDNYGWVEVFGTRGHFANDKVAGGFLILGPEVVYPDHHHEAEEIYIPLTDGTGWRKGEGAFQVRGAGEVIHHPSNVNHAMKTGVEPLLALYLWRGGPLAAKSTLAGGEA